MQEPSMIDHQNSNPNSNNQNANNQDANKMINKEQNNSHSNLNSNNVIAESPEAAESVKSKDLQKIDILLVDDRPENLVVLEAVLNSPHYNLIKANSGREALKYLLTKTPALILMDVQMPDMDGFETVDLIKKSEKTQDIPIIFITAINKDNCYVYEGYDKGAIDYIFKPLDPQILKSKVAVLADIHYKNQKLIQQEILLRESQQKEHQQKMELLQFKAMQREYDLQKRYLDLVEGIQHGLVWSANMEMSEFNFIGNSAMRILNISPEQWVSVPGLWFKFLHPEDQLPFRQALKELGQGKRTEIEIEHRFLKPDGEIIWFHTGIRMGAISPTHGSELRGLSVDITKTKEAEEILRQHKEQSDFLARASFALSDSLDQKTIIRRLGHLVTPKLSDGCFIGLFNEQKTLASWEIFPLQQGKKSGLRKWLETTLHSGPKNISRYWHDLLAKDSGAIHLNFKEILSSQWEWDEEGQELIQQFNFHSAMTVPLLLDGGIKGIIVLFLSQPHRHFHQRDVQLVEILGQRAISALERARLYQKAKDAIRIRDEFISIASHELKTPLTSIMIHTQLLMRTMKNRRQQGPQGGPQEGSREGSDYEKLENMVQVAHRQLGRLSSLVNDLLDISQIHKGKLNMRLEEVNMVELVKDLLERFQDQFELSSCPVEFHCHEEVLKGHWDRMRMEQVITNLLSNAMKYGKGKPIIVEASSQGDRVFLKVKDHGYGMAKEHQSRIFRPFEQIATPYQVSGLGLGLYIVAQVVESHQGQVTVESELGNGATFIVELPFRVAE